MALEKNYSYGTKSGNYWRILGSYVDTMYATTKVKVALYKDRKSREKDEAGYVTSMMFSVDGVVHFRENLYKALKLKEDFKDSKDV